MGSPGPEAQPAIVLRTAALWGTTVLGLKSLASGESLILGDKEGAAVPKPEGCQVADMPVRAVGAGWELDARGATGGKLYLRGREEDPVALAERGAPVPIVAGDYGVLQYEGFSVFFQFSQAPPAIKQRLRIDWGVLLSFLFAAVSVLGGLTLIWALTTPAGIPKPLELTTQKELELQFNMKLEEPLPEPGQDRSEKGEGIEDPGAKDKKKQGGGKKIKGAQGKLGKRGPANKTELEGEPRSGLGGMAEALSSDVGEEVKKTLGTISSVAEALGGLRSDQVVLGRGSGKSLQGEGPGGGGDAEGVPFGSGTLDTGWGAGRGAGYGSGKGGPSGKGKGGRGLGGKGKGKGAGDGTGERKVKAGDKPKPGQGLSPAQIQRVVMSRMGAFRACYESAASRDPDLAGTVRFSWRITPGGSVAGASVAGSSLGNARVEGCVLRQIKRLRFPAADKATRASFPFAFRPSKR